MLELKCREEVLGLFGSVRRRQRNAGWPIGVEHRAILIDHRRGDRNGFEQLALRGCCPCGRDSLLLAQRFGLQPIQHCVEADDHGADLATRAAGHSKAVIRAVVDALSNMRQLLQRTCDLSSDVDDQNQHRKRDPDRRAEVQEHRALEVLNSQRQHPVQFLSSVTPEQIEGLDRLIEHRKRRRGFAIRIRCQNGNAKVPLEFGDDAVKCRVRTLETFSQQRIRTAQERG